MFVIVVAVLSSKKDLITTTLKRISFMLKYMDETDINRKIIISNTLIQLKRDDDKCQKTCLTTLCEFANQNSSLVEDVNILLESLSNLFEKFNYICGNSYKTLVGDIK